MTDKQIITKDVDVRGCKFFRNGICASPINPKCKLCVEISEKMCYYKQLTRKTQECEELKDKIKFMEGYIKTVENARDELERENKFSKEQAKQKLEKIRQICNCSKSQMNCEQCPMCDECEELCVNDENLQDIILQIIDEVE